MTTVIECHPRAAEKPALDLQALVKIIGPRFAEGAADRDAGDVFVAEHYDVLKHHKVFSAPACPLFPIDRAGAVDASASGGGGRLQSPRWPAWQEVVGARRGGRSCADLHRC